MTVGKLVLSVGKLRVPDKEILSFVFLKTIFFH